jgi:hypothetical protein
MYNASQMEKVTRAKKEEEKVVYWVGPKSSLTLNPKLVFKKHWKKKPNLQFEKKKKKKLELHKKKN